MGLFFYNKIGSIISIGDLPTTNIIEPDFNSRKTGQEPTPDLFLLQNDKNHKLFDKYACQKEKDVLQ